MNFRPFHFMLIGFVLAGVPAPAQSSFQISGTIKTREKTEGEKVELPRGDTRLETRQKVLEIDLRRTNPTVVQPVTVLWAVWIRDMRGQILVATSGSREVQTAVGIPVELVSDPFDLKERSFDPRHRRGDDGKLEQEIEGYAVRVVDAEGKEVAVKFQPSSLEAEARELLETRDAKVPQDDRDWSKGMQPNRPRQIRPRELRR